MRKAITLLATLAAIVLAATETSRAVSLVFEREPRSLGPGRSPKFLVRGAHGLQMLLVQPSADGKGQDLYFQASSDGADSFGDPIRVNHVPGEVSDHGENSPQLVASPDNRYLYAVWGGRDPHAAMGGNIRFSRSTGMRPSFSPAITVNDDNLPVSHSFQTVAAGPDGTIYVAWLDGRDAAAGPHGGHASSSSIYLARSTNRGESFEKNVKVAENICPCCRLSITFAGDQVLLAWRWVEPGDVRDIHLASSDDRGQTWSKPVMVGRDGWKINGCPHVGPAIAAMGSKVYAAWFTEGSGDPAINLAVSDDGGRSFGTKRQISEGVFDPTHPQMVAGQDKLAVVFQARSASKEQGWGRVGVYYREIHADGSLSQLVRLPEGKANANYPTVTLGLSGRIFVGWTETSKGESTAYLIRGRSLLPGAH
jgi:hypothetical protein